MPSGAKKRKAAKKKKENEAYTTTSTAHSHGGDDRTTRDERESDGGGEGRKSVEGIVRIGSNSITKDHSEKNNFKSAKESTDKKGLSQESQSSSSSSSSSSGSSSDDESNAVVKNIVVVEVGDSKESCDLVTETSTFVDSVKPVNTLSEAEIPVTSVQAEQDFNSALEIARVDDCEKVSPTVQNGLKELLSGNVISEVSSVVTVLEPQQKKDEVVTTSEENDAANSGEMGFADQENEEKLLLSFNPPRTDTSDGAEHAKDSAIPNSSDSLPLIASAPRPVQTSSWKSCCGLFEVLSGSNR